MKRGDIVFVQGKGIISRMIRLIDGGKFSHCAFAISSLKVIEADYDTPVAARDFDESKYNIIENIDLGLTIEERRRAYNAAVSHLGKKYDLLSLIWYVVNRVVKIDGRNRLNNPNHMICSELIFLILDEVGYLDDIGIGNREWVGIDLTPNQLYDLVKYVSTKKGSQNSRLESNLEKPSA